uniref:Pentatricopeptide repeat-containing protein n=1 Tax=Kalanchoe fedtschenkoi TaxID=63787 RepID=A0A7N0UFM6_KALFE
MRSQLRLLTRVRRTSHHCVATRNISHIQVNTSIRCPSHPFTPSSSFLYPNANPAAFHPIRNFTSEPEQRRADDDEAKKRRLVDIFSADKSPDEISEALESGGVAAITHEFALKVLRDLEASPDTANRFFNWIVANNGQVVSSKTYNFMLGILGANGLTQQFWDLVEVMKKKGFGVKKGAYDRAAAKFEEDGLSEDLEKLRGVYASGSADISDEKLGARAAKIIKNAVWDENVEAQLRSLNGEMFSSAMVVTVLEKVGDAEPVKALIFFRWLEESGLFKHDVQSYNSMLLVLGREDSVDRFWKMAHEMRSAGFELELDTYVKLSDRFCKRRMIKELVNLYEFAMNGGNKPSPSDATFLLRKIVTSKNFDMKLFSRVVKIYTETGDNNLMHSTAVAVLKSLTSVGRLTQCNKILEAMKEGGFMPKGSLQHQIAFQLGCGKKHDVVAEFMEKFGASDGASNIRTWSALIEGNCVAGDLEIALKNFQRMVQKEGVTNSGYAFDLLVNAYCCRNKAKDACKILTDTVSNKKLEPWHDTYKSLITSLLVQDGFTDALGLLGLMKTHGFPPYVDPFIKFISKSGTGDDAYSFLRAMSAKDFPSTLVVIRVFKALFAARRHNVAHDLLSRCPSYIRTDADVLNLFFSKRKSTELTVAEPTPVAA